MIDINERKLTLGNHNSDAIFSVKKVEDNKIRIQEECDGWYAVRLSKEEAIQHFEDIIKYIKNL
jgi:hypothetical protein